MGGSSNAQGPQRPRMVSVELAKAERKSVPVDVDAIGMVTPISSVALKSRLETTIVAVHFEDGAKVNEGDLLFTLDSRQIDAQIEQAEGVLAKDQAQLEGAQRDLRRFTDLVGKGATTQVNVDNAKTQSDILAGYHQGQSGRARQSEGPEKLHHDPRAVLGPDQRGQCESRQFRAPGRYSRRLPSSTRWRRSMCRSRFRSACWSTCASRWRKGTPGVTATIPGHQRSETGKVAMVENTVDATTGMVTVRGIMNNANETLWPGTLVATKLVIRSEDSIVVPTVAVQRSQSGNFVFVIKDGVAKVQPVKVDRTSQGMSVISEGLAGDESVVVDGQLLLSDGSRVEARTKKAGA